VVRAYVKNTSGEPVYDAELRWQVDFEGYGEPNPEPVGTPLPLTSGIYAHWCPVLGCW
jgi:hypothetical protein